MVRIISYSCFENKRVAQHFYSLATPSRSGSSAAHTRPKRCQHFLSRLVYHNSLYKSKRRINFAITVFIKSIACTTTRIQTPSDSFSTLLLPLTRISFQNLTQIFHNSEYRTRAAFRRRFVGRALSGQAWESETHTYTKSCCQVTTGLLHRKRDNSTFHSQQWSIYSLQIEVIYEGLTSL